ncbi:hypothetical protein [Sinisalibacter lacisalsi]|uniref:Flagellar FliJ protein n=1 Tax=Sinisalibacter lacisalsi TaxID=1526570 RepID=A0ABQ1QE25_9RHOB|nr:hypothetical protein [Sinisalibacter lacisalsi]GGD22848.1 hypothetical protein GCM10011358_04220 [Sinisalibacter lacisalsi]
MKSGLADLEVLTTMVLDRELARLRELAEVVRQRQRAVADLAEASKDRSAALLREDGAGDLAALNGRDPLWQAWLHRERDQRQAAVARAMAEMEAQRLLAGRAFGRADAVRQMRRAEIATKREVATRRSIAEPGGD